MKTLTLALENAIKDLGDSDARISLATQTALLFFLLTLTLTSASVQRYLASNLDQMLGSDLVVENVTPLTEQQESDLRARADRVSRTTLTTITLAKDDAWARVQLKEIDAAYPLQGSLQIGDTPASPQRTAAGGPALGTIWLGPRAAAKLGVAVGDMLTIGETRLEISAILFHEPDRIMEGHSVAMRAMVHGDSLIADPLETSDARSRYLVAADEAARQSIETWVKADLPGAKIIKRYGGEHPLAGFWRRAENFLGLASVILFFMGAVALDMTNRRWLAKMRYRLAVYASFGTSIKRGIAIAFTGWVSAFVITVVLATLLAAPAYVLILDQLRSYFPDLMVSIHIGPALKTIGLVFLLLLALQIPSFIQLSQASLMSLIRAGEQGRFVWQRLFWGLTSVALLAAAYSDNWLLTAMTLSAVVFALVLMVALTWSVVRLGDAWGRKRTGLLPFAFFIMRQRLLSKSAQVMGLGLCGLLLLFTLMLMQDLSGMMKGYGRTHDGNLLISEAQSDQIDAIEAWAQKTGSSVKTLRPFVSAQLVAVNGVVLDQHVQKPSDTASTLKEPIRLSWSDKLPQNNKLVGGTWWAENTEDWQQISAEPEVMTDMGFDYGDTLTYQIEGQAYDFTLVASHAFKPGGGSITFWFQVPLAARPHIAAPTRFIGSMELPDTAWDHLGSLWQQYPTLSLAPLKELTDRFDRLLLVVTKTTSGFAGMVLLLALFVLAASVSGFRADDQKKNGLLMSMGLQEKDCLWLNFHDWGITALIAAAGAISGTWLAGWLIYEAQFGLSYQPDGLWIAGTVMAMVSLVCLVGYLACRKSLKVSVRDLLAS